MKTGVSIGRTGGALEVLSEDLHDCGKVFRNLSVLRITVLLNE